MSRSIVLFHEQQEILYENFLSDLAAKLKSQDFLKSISNKLSNIDISKKLKQIEHQLEQNNIDTNQIKKIINKNIKKINIKNIKETSLKLKDNLLEILNEVKQTIPGKISLSIITLVFVLIIGYYLSPVVLHLGAQLGLSEKICSILPMIFISPLLEEYAKFISIKHSFTGEYFIAFNVFEFTAYIFIFLNLGIGLVPAIISRSLALMMHAITTYIQYKFRNESKNKDDEEHQSRIGLLAGIVIHFFWNLGSVALVL